MTGGEHHIEVEAHAARPTVTKSARGAAAARLRVEAAALRAAAHPGVVALAGEPTTDADGTVRLRTRFAGSTTLATIGPVEPARAAALVAAVAATVADLHDLGIVHGRLTADHVIVAADGRPVLCGFAEARTVGDPAAAADDVAALGHLLHDLVAPSPERLEEAPSRRLLYRRPTGTHLRGALLNLADQATADDPLRRPSARHLAAAIGATVPDAPLRPPPHPPTSGRAHAADAARPVDSGRRSEDLHPLRAGLSDPPPSLRRLGFLLPAAAGAVAVLAIVATAVVGSGPSAPTLADGSTPPAPSPTTPTTVVTPTSTSIAVDASWAAVDAAAGCATVADATTSATADGAPCPTVVSVRGRTLVVGDTAFDLGVDRPAVALGDFGCDGRVRPAVVDLAAGHVFVFDGWARAAQPLDAVALDHVDAPRQAIAEPSGDGCHRLVVLDSWGLRHVVDTTPHASEATP